MSDYIEEELRRILDDGSAELAGPLSDLRSKMAAEDGVMPKGTKVVFAEPELDVAGPPMRQPLRPKPAVPEVPAEKTLDVSKEPMGDLEEAYARAADRRNQARQLFERGGRELVAGLTRTEVQPIATPGSTKFADLLAKRKRGDDARRQDNAERLGAAKFSAEEARAKAAEARSLEERDYRRQRDLKGDEERATDNERAERGMKLQAETNRLGMGLKFKADAREEAKTGKPKDLTPSALAELADLPVAEKQIDAVAEAFGRLNMGGMGGKAAGAVTDALNLQGTDAAEYNAAVALAMQAAGKIVEGGKLAAGDEVKYRKMMPKPGDSPDVVKQKVEGMKSFLREMAGRRAQAYREANYNVPDSLMPTAPARQRAQSADGKVIEWDGSQWVEVKP